MGSNISQILAWESRDKSFDPEESFAQKSSPVTTPLEDFEKLSLRVLEPGYESDSKNKKYFITEIWVDREMNYLYDHIANQNKYHLSENVQSKEVIFAEQDRVDKAAGRFFLYLAHKEIARLCSRTLIFNYEQIREVKDNASHLFARAADVPGVPTQREAKRLVHEAAAKATLRFLSAGDKKSVDAGKPDAVVPKRQAPALQSVLPLKAQALTAARYVN